MTAHWVRKGSEFFCGFVTATFGVFALVLAISSTFNTGSSSTASTCSSAPPPPPPTSDGCDPDALRSLISIFVRCLASAQFCSLVLIFFVRGVVERAHAAHERVAKDEDAAYKAASDAHQEACRKLARLRRTLEHRNKEVRKRPDDEACWTALTAAQDEEEVLMAVVERAKQDADSKKPKEGMERITGRLGKAVRISFFLSVCFSQLAGVCAGFAFYYSLQIQEHCVFGGVLEVLAFTFALGFSLPFHGFFGWIAISQN
ncbi:hypothetical protein TRIUR3_13504 [Triticum urartu]|uniref:Uncharacterized protein n=1 Tax=Triticum urartu TaxID=4572 RepID=M7Z4R7_TRIUA|nr:hypothetical protein TRIUR3_13504 [Triticum urartu]